MYYVNLIRTNCAFTESFGFCFKIITLIVETKTRLSNILYDSQQPDGRARLIKLAKTSAICIEKKRRSLARS